MNVPKAERLKRLREGSLTDRLLKLLKEQGEDGMGAQELQLKLGTSRAMVRDLTLHLRRQGLVVKAPVIYRLTPDGTETMTRIQKERDQS